MAATAIPIDTLPSINPATGEVLAHFERTTASSLPEIVSRVRLVQRDWAKLPIRDRCLKLRGLRDRFMPARNELSDAGVRESGTPRGSALCGYFCCSRLSGILVEKRGERLAHEAGSASQYCRESQARLSRLRTARC